MTPEQSFIETWVSPYFWEFMAIIIMPFLAFRVTQFIKRSYKRGMGGESIHWLILQFMTFGFAWVSADYCLEHIYDEATSLFLGFVIAVFAGTIINYVIEKSRLSAPALYAALVSDQMFVEKKTITHRVVSVLSGVNIREGFRDSNSSGKAPGKERRGV